MSLSPAALIGVVRSNFRDLVAYRQAFALAHDVYEAIGRWPRFDRFGLGDQLQRSADSIGANIAEAAGRWTPAEKRRFLLIARGSLYETEHWLACAQDRVLAVGTAPDRLDELARALSGMIKRPDPG